MIGTCYDEVNQTLHIYYDYYYYYITTKDLIVYIPKTMFDMQVETDCKIPQRVSL